jgi:hypothetical protein
VGGTDFQVDGGHHPRSLDTICTSMHIVLVSHSKSQLPQLLCIQPKQKKGAERTLMANAGSRHARRNHDHSGQSLPFGSIADRLQRHAWRIQAYFFLESGLRIGYCPSLVTVSDA